MRAGAGRDARGPARRSRAARRSSAWSPSPSVGERSRRRRCGTAPRPDRRRSPASVTVCSTWMRGLHSMKKCSPRSGIDQELDRAGVHIAGGAGELRSRRRGCAGAARRRGSAPARSRPPSGCAAAPSSRARRDGRSSPAASARICTSMWRGRCDQLLDEQRRRRRTPPRASLRQRAKAAAISPAPSTRAHAAPAAAGRRLQHHRVAELVGDRGRGLGARQRRMRCRARSERPATGRARAPRTLSPNSASVSGRGPTKARPSARQRRAKAAFSARKP